MFLTRPKATGNLAMLSSKVLCSSWHHQTRWHSPETWQRRDNTGRCHSSLLPNPQMGNQRSHLGKRIQTQISQANTLKCFKPQWLCGPATVPQLQTLSFVWEKWTPAGTERGLFSVPTVGAAALEGGDGGFSQWPSEYVLLLYKAPENIVSIYVTPFSL